MLPTNSLAESLASLPAPQRAKLLSEISDAEAEALLWRWDFWGRQNQLAPPGDWSTWVILAGRGFGKTRAGAEWVRSLMCGASPLAMGKAKRIALIAETAADGRDVMVQGESGLLSVHPADFRPTYTPSMRKLVWPNGAIGLIYNATEPDQLRGPQFDAAWSDELCFVAGTLIETARGPVPIEGVRTGDTVPTRFGLRRVTAAGRTQGAAELWELTTTSGNRLVGTGNHPIFTEENGFVPLSALASGVTLLAWSKNQSKAMSSSGAASAGIATRTTTRTARASSCIASGIRTLMVRFRAMWTSITSTRTRPTLSWEIWSPSRAASTSNAISRAGSWSGAPRSVARTSPTTCGASASRRRASARTAGASSPPSACAPSSAPATVPLQPSASATPATTPDSVATVRRLSRRAPVYNLEVEGDPEYFANGILVHNCKWRYAQETWDNLQFGLRLGSDPRQLITTTPRPIQTLKDILKEAGTVITKGSTYENRSNLAPKFLKKVEERYAGTRLGRQELMAEILDDSPDALWQRARIDEERIGVRDGSHTYKGNPITLPAMRRIVVSIDPAGAPGGEGDISAGAETGIIVSGLGVNGRGYVLDDRTCSADPNGWATEAIKAYDFWEADCIVVETNMGGAMVKAVIRSVRPTVPVIEVTASRGKVLRAEPISALYAQGRISHVGSFPQLEDQMVVFTPFGIVGGTTGDRVDACLVAGTKVQTDRGPRLIEQIAVGDLVLTREGHRRVQWAGLTQASAMTTNVHFSDGRILTATDEHPILVRGQGFVATSNLAVGDEIVDLSEVKAWMRQSRRSLWSTTAASIGGSLKVATKRIATTIADLVGAIRANAICTVSSGLTTTGPFQKDGTSITATRTSSTTSSETTNAFPQRSTASAIEGNEQLRTVRPWITPAVLLPSGTDLKKGERGIASTGRRHGLVASLMLQLSARIAARRSAPSLAPELVAAGVATAPESATTQWLRESGATLSMLFVRFAGATSKCASGANEPSHARVSVVGFSDGATQPVYNLHVDGVHEFFANGVLVHNCVHGLTNLFPSIINFKDKAAGIKKAPPDRWRSAFNKRTGGEGNDWKTT